MCAEIEIYALYCVIKLACVLRLIESYALYCVLKLTCALRLIEINLCSVLYIKISVC